MSKIPADFDWKNPDYEPILDERIARLQALRDMEHADRETTIAALKAHYKDNPVDFINDWGMTYDPRNADIGRPTNIPFLMFPKQEEFVRWIHDHWRGRRNGIAEKSREMGVSWLCVAFACWMYLFHPGSAIGFGSRKEIYVDELGDPKSIFEKIRFFLTHLPVELRPKGFNQQLHMPYMKVVNPENGATITGEAGDNIGRGARTSIYFVDESAFLEHAMKIEGSLSQTTNCRIDVSTANGPDNVFAVKRRSGKIDVFTFHWKADPRKGEDWFRKQVETLDPVVVAQEIEINYEASTTNALISGEIVALAQATPKVNVSQKGQIRISVDVARFGNNETVISVVRGRACIEQKCYRTKDTVFVAGAVRAKVIEYGEENIGQIAVDDIGVGGGVTDQLRQWYPDLVEPINAALLVDDGINYNLRAQMYANLLDWLEDLPSSIPNDPELKAQLCGIKYRFRAGKRILESKKESASSDIADNVSKSPDRADSLALAFAKPVSVKKRKVDYSMATWGGAMDVETGY